MIGCEVHTVILNSVSVHDLPSNQLELHDRQGCHSESSGGAGKSQSHLLFMFPLKERTT